MASVSTQYKYLERRPNSNHKQLVVKGTKIFARTLYGQYRSEEEPRTVEEVYLPIAMTLKSYTISCVKPTVRIRAC